MSRLVHDEYNPLSDGVTDDSTDHVVGRVGFVNDDVSITLLHLSPNVVKLRSLLHLRPNVITFRTLLQLGSVITFRSSTHAH